MCHKLRCITVEKETFSWSFLDSLLLILHTSASQTGTSKSNGGGEKKTVVAREQVTDHILNEL